MNCRLFRSLLQIIILSRACCLASIQPPVSSHGFLARSPEDPDANQINSRSNNCDGDDFVEPVLRNDPGRYALLPIRYPKLWNMYKQHEASFWTAEEVDLSSDLADWAKLSDGERHFVKMVLAFFAGSDGVVMENLAHRFCREVTVPEARCFYGFQIAMEAVHTETYALLLEQYVRDPVERRRLFMAYDEVPAVAAKNAWAQKWLNSETDGFATRLVAFACVEGIFFSGSFCAVYWLKKRGLMPGLTFSNELIARDEGLHCDFACELYGLLERPLDPEVLTAVVREAVEVEKAFICEALPTSLIGMNDRLMGQYIEFCADRLLGSLGAPRTYGAANPFDWMGLISLEGKTNFFEKRVGEYQKAGVMQSCAARETPDEGGNESAGSALAPDENRKFDLDADF